MPIVWNPYRITPIHWLMARMLPLTFLKSYLILANTPSAPQISLPSWSGHISHSCCDPSDPISINFLGFLFICTSATTVTELCSPRSEYPPSARFIASDDPHSKYVKCMGFLHAREVVYGVSKCTFCENLHLKTLRTRLEVFERESSLFPRRTPEASAAFRESVTWG